MKEQDNIVKVISLCLLVDIFYIKPHNFLSLLLTFLKTPGNSITLEILAFPIYPQFLWITLCVIKKI